MRCLITGGAGFIGSHLAEEMLGRGCAVHILDDLSTGSFANFTHLLGRDDFGHTVGSCDDEQLVADLIEDADVIFHLAAAVGVQLIVASPVRTIETNVHCTEVVLRHASAIGRPVLLASTSEVYGKSTALPFTEGADLLLGPTDRGRWAYACSKAIDEFLALAYHRERGLPVVIARLFNTVGPRQTGRYGMVVPTFVRQALAGLPVTVFGDGTQQRCFCHVADVVRALGDLAVCEQARGRVFNVGSTEEVSMLELAARVIDAAGSSSPTLLVPYDQAYEAGFEDMTRRIPSIVRVRAATGWAPTRSLDEIIVDVIAYERRLAAA